MSYKVCCFCTREGHLSDACKQLKMLQQRKDLQQLRPPQPKPPTPNRVENHR